MNKLENHVYFIAEAGVNHNGNPELAHKLVDEAANAGADAIKFQTWDRELVTRRDNPLVPYQEKNTDGAVTDMYELGKTFELKLEDFVNLDIHCKERGIQFLSTAFDIPSLDFLINEIGVPILKVPSGEVVNVPLLRAIAKSERPIILSTGMCDLDEIKLAVDTIGTIWKEQNVSPDLTLLHCTTAYPTPPEEIHLRSMQTIAQTFNLPVGLSDHSEGTLAAVAAVGMGARIVEKHFTLDRSLPGPDHKASVDIAMLNQLIGDIRTVENMLGSKKKELREIEKQVVKSVRRSLVATRDIQIGEIIQEIDVVPLRPEDGIPARDIGKVVGQKAWKEFAKGKVLTWD